jgi:hypothetical protein
MKGALLFSSFLTKEVETTVIEFLDNWFSFKKKKKKKKIRNGEDAAANPPA